MPNWVKQRVIARDFAELKKHLVNENGSVDFNMVIPMSEDLRITSGSYSYEMPSKYFPNFDDRKKLQEQKDTVDVLFKELYTDTITQQEFFQAVMKRKDILKAIRAIKEWYTRKTEKHPYAMSKENLAEGYEIYIKGFFNLQRYGERDWYDWCIQNWGTKWNASRDFVDEDYQVLEFETAWAIPEKVYFELCKYTPIRVLYADEDLGSNCGMVDFFIGEDGNPTYEIVLNGSIELANDTWGYPYISVYDNEQDDWVEDEENPKFKEANKNYFKVQEKINSLMNQECMNKDFAEV